VGRNRELEGEERSVLEDGFGWRCLWGSCDRVGLGMVRPGQRSSVPSAAEVAMGKLTAPKKFECPQCGQPFLTKREMDAHERQAHRGELVSCPKCMAKFTTRRTLLVHQSSVHSPVRVKCMVEGCDIMFSRFDNMRAHVRAYHPSATFKGAELPGGTKAIVASDPVDKADRYVLRHQCNICKKTYSTQSYLYMHIHNVHEGAEYKCPNCPKIFNSRGYLHRHFTAHHAATADLGGDAASSHIADMPDVVFKCEACNRNFARQASLAIHRYSMHGLSFPTGSKETSASDLSPS